MIVFAITVHFLWSTFLKWDWLNFRVLIYCLDQDSTVMPEAREFKQKLLILNDLWPCIEQLDVVVKTTDGQKCMKMYYKHQYVEYKCL